MSTTLERAGNHIAPVLITGIAVGCRQQKSPIIAMDGDNLLAEFVQLVQPIELLQTVPGLIEI